MTPTLILWIKIGIICQIAWIIWDIGRALYRQKKIIPSTPEEWKRILPEIFFLGLGIFFFFWIEKNFQRQINIVVNEKDRQITNLHFANLQTGQMDSLAAYKGKVVILNIWATWCAPCRRELPILDKLYNTYKDRLVVLALSDENEPVIRNFKSQVSFSFITGAYINHSLLDSIDSRPVSILLDRDNRIKDVVVGSREYSFFENWVEPYLE
jgi:thiol-disulfide isomerase/thioredoxin